MLAVLLATVSVPAGLLFWFKICLPLDRVLQRSSEEQHPDWAVSANETRAEIEISGSLANLSTALQPSAPVESVDSHASPKHDAVPAA